MKKNQPGGREEKIIQAQSESAKIQMAQKRRSTCQKQAAESETVLQGRHSRSLKRESDVIGLCFRTITMTAGVGSGARGQLTDKIMMTLLASC